MRIVRPALIGLTLGLTVVSVYLATVVAAERARAQDVAQQRRAVTIRLEKLTASQSNLSHEAESATDTTSPAATPAAPTRAPTEDDGAAGGWHWPSATDRLRELTDPATRAAIRTQQREWERSVHPRLASELRLSLEDADELFTILAEQNLRHEERHVRNRIAGRREFVDGGLLDATAQEELTRLLGTKGFQTLREYRDVLPERRRVEALTERLGKADALTASEASQLTEVMRAERAAFESLLRGLPGDVRFHAGAPEAARLRGAKDPAQHQFLESHVARLDASYARIRERASAFLSPAQIQRLRQLHDERIADVQRDSLWVRYVAPAEEALREAETARNPK
jgi:hypothetical protein